MTIEARGSITRMLPRIWRSVICNDISPYRNVLPVGDGDTVQITPDNGRRLLFDFRRQDGSESPGALEMDIAEGIAPELDEAERSAFDVVALVVAPGTAE